MASPNDGHEFEAALGVGDGWERLACFVHGVTKCQTRLRTELNSAIAHPRAVSCGVFDQVSQVAWTEEAQPEGLVHRTFSAKMKSHRPIRTHWSLQLSGLPSCFSALSASENVYR